MAEDRREDDRRRRGSQMTLEPVEPAGQSRDNKARLRYTVLRHPEPKPPVTVVEKKEKCE